ncbi:unnamed protein product [Effrenium voratum]|nr:unnamed protein product [Effrenium voratum]
MPRGGHMGLWKPLPRDIFKSRWKRFFKRCWRPRSGGNQVDRAGPHIQGDYWEAVPSPWKLHLREPSKAAGADAYKDGAGANSSLKVYRRNQASYLRPAMMCREGTASDIILRCLDAGRRSSFSLTGLGKLEAAWFNVPESGNPRQETAWEDAAPRHILDELEKVIKERKETSSQEPYEVLASPSNNFKVRRLFELCEEKEIVWDGGQIGARRRTGREEASKRGNFPYIDEQAGLLDELNLDEILRLRHKTKSRRLPKWKAISWWFKRWHRVYLRRRAMVIEEVKATEGVSKKALSG